MNPTPRCSLTSLSSRSVPITVTVMQCSKNLSLLMLSCGLGLNAKNAMSLIRHVYRWFCNSPPATPLPTCPPFIVSIPSRTRIVRFFAPIRSLQNGYRLFTFDPALFFQHYSFILPRCYCYALPRRETLKHKTPLSYSPFPVTVPRNMLAKIML